MFREARWRLVAWNVLVFAAVLAALGATAYAFFASRIYSEVNQELSNQQTLVDSHLPESQYDPSNLFANYPSLVQSPYRAVFTDAFGGVNGSSECYRPVISVSPSGCVSEEMRATSIRAIQQVLARADNAPPSQGFQTIRDIRNATFRGQPWRVLTYAVLVDGSPQGVVQIARSIAGEESALRQMQLLLIFGGLLGVLLAALGSLFLAGKALIPLRQAFNRQRQFTADASHELRTPLALIRANAEMISRHGDHLPEGDCELLGEIIYETDHLNRLVGDLLTLARSDAQSVRLVKHPVDFRALVSEVHDDLRHIAEQRGIDTSISLDGPVTLSGDEVRLRQLLLILLDNALKYTESGGRVDVSLQRDENRAHLVVADTGIGIPSAEIHHIFERFYRVDRAREHEGGGTGLGLAIARWIVQAHNGTIRAESEPGRGSRFKVDLPV